MNLENDFGDLVYNNMIDGSTAVEGAEEVGKLMSQESLFLSLVMTESWRRKLVVEWRKQAALVDVSVQTSNPRSNAETQVG